MEIMPLSSPTGRVNLKVLRHVGGYYDEDGMWVGGQYQEVSVIANVQPANRWNVQQQLKEGDRQKDSILVLCYDNLVKADDRADPSGNPQVKTKADIVVWKDKYYEVKTAEPYEMGVLNHCECICVRLDDESPFLGG